MKTITKTLLILITFIFAGSTLMAQYCIPPGFKDMGGSGEPFTFISKVELEDLSNSTGMPTGEGDDNGYMHYTSATVPTITPGYKHTLKVTSNDNLGGGMNVVVWFDFDGNQKFDGPGERVIYSGGAGEHVKEFTVPENAVHGITRMRVYCDMPSTMGHIEPEPCGYLDYPSHQIGQHGEVEDYDVQIGSPTGITSTDQVAAISIYPNPVGSILNINNIPENANYVISDIYGRVLRQGTFNNVNEELNVSDFANGQYILTFQEENRLQTKTFYVSH